MKKLSLIDLANTVKNNRAEKNITQEQLCEKTGINRNTIGRIERMDYIPTIPHLKSWQESSTLMWKNCLLKVITQLFLLLSVVPI